MKFVNDKDLTLDPLALVSFSACQMDEYDALKIEIEMLQEDLGIE